MIFAGMPFDRWFKISLSLLALDAAAGLLATSFLSFPVFAIMASVLLLEGWTDSGHLRIARRLEPLMPAGFLLFLFLDYLFLRSLSAALTRLFLAFLVYKLLDLSTHRDILWVYLFTFILLFVTATQTTSPVFLGVFVGYVALGTWSWILFHLKRETETALPGRGTAALTENRLITPRFMLCSLGLALGCLSVTLGLFFMIPRVDLASLNQITQHSIPASGYANRTSLQGLGVIELDPTVVMRVAFPNGSPPQEHFNLRWRGTSLDAFDGQAWFQGTLTRPVLERDGRDFVFAQPMTGQPLFVQEISLEPLSGRQLFAAPTLLRLQGPFPALHFDSGDGIVVPAKIDRPLRYVAVSDLGPPRPERLGAGDGLIAPKISERYLALPAVSSRVKALAREITEAAPTPYAAALLIEGYLKTQFLYRLGVTPTPGADPLEDFLFTQKQGHCEYFAGSMAVLLRTLGIPSRVATGFQKGEWNNIGRFYTVRQRDAHAWVEAYFPESGWVSFDPSARAEGRAASRDGWTARAVEAFRLRWTRYVIQYNVGDQIGMATSIRNKLQEGFSWLARGWNRLASGTSGPPRELAEFVTICMAGLGLIVWLSIQRVIPARLFFRRGRPRSPVVFYERMLRLLTHRGYIRPVNSTAREFSSSLAEHPVHEPVAEITALYERVRFGRELLSQADERRAVELLGTLRSVTRRAAGRMAGRR